MNITSEEFEILKGRETPLLSKYFNILCRWKEAMNAKKLVPVKNVHAILTFRGNYLQNASPKTLERELNNLKETCSHKVVAHTTTHTAYMDVSKWQELGIDEKQATLQLELLNWGRKAGFLMTWTCAPYLVGNVPIKGEICAWTESSAVVYANSILGARTTRHGDVSALAAALLGVTPEFGVLLTENRRADLTINVQTRLTNDSDWGALGYYAGNIAGLKIPIFRGIDSLTQEDAKQLSAALASSGGVSMFHIENITPEAHLYKDVCSEIALKNTFNFTRQELKETYGKYNSKISGNKVDNVVLGCPHASLEEIRIIAELLEGKKISKDLNLWVCTAYANAIAGKRYGYYDIIENAGGTIISDTCPANWRPSSFVNGKRMVTNSFKQAHYSKNFGMEVFITSLPQCVEIAIKGEIKDSHHMERGK
jgi:predicted aconitase